MILVVDEYPDLPAAGLAKFNLGSIPASVTPPRSWRRAAWFAVTASALVLIGLVYAAATLVTAPRRPDVVDALPGLPTVPHPFSEPVETTVAVDDEPLSRSVPPTTTTARTTPPTTTAAPARGPAPAADGEQALRPLSVPSGAPPQPTRVTVSTPVLLGPVTDAQAMGDQTEAYYQQVVADPTAAHALTAGELYREGPESIQRRYAGIERVEVRSITIDANEGTTLSELRVVREDGTVTTVERELTFTYGSNPRISADTAAS